MTTNTQLLAVAKKQLGNGGSKYRSYVGAGGNYCNMFVYWLFNANGCAALLPLPSTKYYRTYCPDSIKWCRKNLAEIPPYLAMACDIIYMDWEPNGVPNHIGIVDHKVSTAKIATIEGNTSGIKNGKSVSGIVAAKTRNTKYTNVFRPHFKGSFSLKTLKIDGDCGYNTIAGLQQALKILKYYTGSVDGILGIQTVKALQKWAGVKADGAWGPATSKAVQKKIVTKADGAFGEKSVIALQKWINANAFPSTKKPSTSSSTVTKPTTASTNAQKIVNKANELAWPYGTTSSKWDYSKGSPTSKCQTAMKSFGFGTKAKMSDCGNFVNTIVRGSGVDKSFTVLHAVKTAFPKTEAKFNIVHSGKAIPNGFLKPGDVVRYKKTNNKDQHALIYMGNGRICEARHYHRFGNIYKDEKRYAKSNVKTSTIQVLRAKEG